MQKSVEKSRLDARLTVLFQLAFALCVSLIVSWQAPAEARSFLLGAGTLILPGLFSGELFFIMSRFSPTLLLWAFYFSQVVKFLLVGVLVSLSLIYADVHPLMLLLGVVCALAGFWLAPLLFYCFKKDKGAVL